MDREQAIKELQALQQNGDIEYAHSRADEVLCEFLKTLGYTDVVEAWSVVGKWYA